MKILNKDQDIIVETKQIWKVRKDKQIQPESTDTDGNVIPAVLIPMWHIASFTDMFGEFPLASYETEEECDKYWNDIIATTEFDIML